MWVKDKVFADADDFLTWLDSNFREYIKAHITENHVHHTWAPNHASYGKYTTLQLHQNMRSYHVNTNKWADIAQNITIGKDGDIVTGRDISQTPVSATGYNGTKDKHPFAYEMVGNFDTGNDKLEGKQLEAAVKVSRYFYKLSKPIKFHRELLINRKPPKSCPGTGVDKEWFMSLVKAEQEGWKKDNGKWYFYKDGAMVKLDWVKHTDGKWYYLKADGVMAAGEWVKDSGKWYFLDSTGAMKTGLIEDKGKLYFLQKDGSMLANGRINVTVNVGKDGSLHP